MTNCPNSQEISAYLDGELKADRRIAMERHLIECPPCQTELNALSTLSQLIVGQEEGARLSPFSLHRLHARVDAVMEEGLIRLARVFQAVAACVLVAGSVWLMHSAPVTAPTQTASVTPPVVWEQSTDEAATPAAAFYLADAQGNSSDDLP